MSQDRRKNGWIFISSALQIILSIVLLSAGIALAVTGFFYKEKLATIDDLQFFVSQKFFTQFNLKTEFLYLFMGTAIGVIGVLLLIFGVAEMIYAQKRKVVRRRVKVIIFALLHAAIAGAAGYYYMSEMKSLPENIKYILYGIIGAFGVCALFSILGILFGRSEKFMSNDNNKFAFDNSSLRNARADVNNNVKMAEEQYYDMAQWNDGYNYTEQPQQAPPYNSAYVQPNQYVAGPEQQRPTNNPNVQPVRPPQPMNRPSQPPRPRPVPPTGVSRPVQAMRQPSIVQQRPAQARPVPPASRPINTSTKTKIYCPRCGSLISMNDKVCATCGQPLNN